MSFTSLLVERCDIQRRSSGSGTDDHGGDTDAFGVIAAAVPCRTYGWTGAEARGEGRTQTTVDTGIDFLPGVDITTRDRVVIGARTFEVLAVSPVGAGHHLVVRAASYG